MKLSTVTKYLQNNVQRDKINRKLRRLKPRARTLMIGRNVPVWVGA